MNGSYSFAKTANERFPIAAITAAKVFYAQYGEALRYEPGGSPPIAWLADFLGVFLNRERFEAKLEQAMRPAAAESMFQRLPFVIELLEEKVPYLKKVEGLAERFAVIVYEARVAYHVFYHAHKVAGVDPAIGWLYDYLALFLEGVQLTAKLEQIAKPMTVEELREHRDALIVVCNDRALHAHERGQEEKRRGTAGRE